MRRLRPVSLAAAAGGALVLTAALAGPALAADTGPNTSECINAKAVLAGTQTAQADAQAKYNKAVEDRDDALDAHNEALSDGIPGNEVATLADLNEANAAVLIANLLLNEREGATAAAQAEVDEKCAKPAPAPTSTPVPTPAPTNPPPTVVTPTPTPVPPTNVTIVRPAPDRNITIVNPPAESAQSFSQIGAAPSGSIDTGDGTSR